MRLKHMVKDKINYRATGKRSALTRQTNQGRANDGGLRIGEMERDGIMGHGLSYFLNESYMVRGDQYYMAVCNKTGTIAIYNPDKNLFLSPMSDGPLTFNRTPEGEPILDVFSRFGRSFSLLRVPYALKLLIQELQVLNIQMRIITEENVDQLLNLSYQSKNLNKLIRLDSSEFKDINELVTQYKTETLANFNKSNAESIKKINKNYALKGDIQNLELQKFEGINIENQALKENSDDKYAAERKAFADELAADLANDTRPGWGDVSDAELADFDRQMAKSWYPAAERGETHSPASASNWVPQNEWESSSSSSNKSPGYAPPDFNDQMLKEYWNKLTNEEQRQILNLPQEQQEEATRNLIINRSQPPFNMPNYGSDGELNGIFAGLPRLEQIELLKLSHQRQIDKLMKMAKSENSSEDFSKLRIIIPENKTSSEELYGSPKLQMLAPVSPVTEEKKSDDKPAEEKDASSSSNSSNSSNSNIKKVSF
jgi:hypothetical protein